METAESRIGTREQPRNNDRAHVMTVQQNEAAQNESSGLNQEKIERVRSPISSLKRLTGSRSLAYSGEFSSSNGVNASSTTFANSKTLDLGATNHMTDSPNVFSAYSLCPRSRKIATAD